MINPCKPNCLRYPLCISIRSLRCAELHHYYHMIVKHGMNSSEVWEHIRSFLPRAGSISNAADSPEDYFPKELEHEHVHLKSHEHSYLKSKE